MQIVEFRLEGHIVLGVRVGEQFLGELVDLLNFFLELLLVEEEVVLFEEKKVDPVESF